MFFEKISFFVLAFFCFFSDSAFAQTAGRPDPTGQGRYLQFGNEKTYPTARVMKTLPAGAACASAGELIGVRVWNSTRTGKAIISQLTEKAEVAVIGDQIFLCKCAEGFNQLFLIQKTAVATTPTIPTIMERIIEKRVEVPVERIVEKRVEIPVDRVVEVEKIVEKVVYVDRPTPTIVTVTNTAASVPVVMAPTTKCSDVEVLKLVEELRKKSKGKNFEVSCGGQTVKWEEKPAKTVVVGSNLGGNQAQVGSAGIYVGAGVSPSTGGGCGYWTQGMWVQSVNCGGSSPNRDYNYYGRTP